MYKIELNNEHREEARVRDTSKIKRVAEINMALHRGLDTSKLIQQ